jgi:signal transduction histidine kinase
MKLNIIRNLGKISIVILVFTIILSIGVVLSSYFLLKNKDYSSYNDINEKISDDYTKKFEIYLNYTTSYIQFAKGYANRFDIFNSTEDDFIKLSALNDSDTFSAVTNLRIHYNVSLVDRFIYEQRMSFTLGKPIPIVDLQSDGTTVISPDRPYYCPNYFFTPITKLNRYTPGLDVCAVPTIIPIIDKLINNPGKVIIEPRFSVILKVVVLDFLDTIPGGIVFLTIAVNNVLRFIIKDSERIKLYKDNKLFYDSCHESCLGYLQVNRNVILPNSETVNMIVLFPSKNNISRILFILLGVIVIDIIILILVIKSDVQKNRFVIVDQMIGYVNHEIRNPLNAINGLIEICLIKLDNQRNLFNSKKEQETIYDKHIELESNLYTAKRACNMLTHIVNDILDLKRIKDGKLIITKDYIDVKDFVENLRRILVPKLNESPDVEYIFQNPNNIESVYFDEQRLLQILLNFLTNSLKFTDSGRIILLLESPTQNTIKISVIDTGRGIPEKDFKNIFKPFEQNDIEDSLRQGGLGIGLQLCKLIIDQTGDKIGFSSDVGDGSTFWISFENKKNV